MVGGVLWELLRSAGIGARLDQSAEGQPQDWPLWMLGADPRRGPRPRDLGWSVPLWQHRSSKISLRW